MTEVAGGPPNQMNVKKNNFFTEPDESMIQKSILLQHNQFYGLQHNNNQNEHPQQI